MTTIELPRRLANPLQLIASQQGTSVKEVVEDVLTDYLQEQRHQQLLQEMERYQTQFTQLKDEYVGQYIGMYNGRILDHDLDGGILYYRLREKYDDLPILIVEVTNTPEQQFVRLHRHIAP